MLPSGKRGRRPNTVCFLCEKTIVEKEDSFQIPIEWIRVFKDSPKVLFNVNIPVHKNCYKETPEKTLENALKTHINTLL